MLTIIVVSRSYEQALANKCIKVKEVKTLAHLETSV